MWGGERSKWLEEEAEADPEFNPAALAERPVLEEHLTFVWGAFSALKNDRQMLQGWVGGIWFSSIKAYADAYDIVDVDEFDRFLTLVGAMDDVWRDHMTKNMPKGDGG